MENLLSIVTLLPAMAALILLVFLRGEDAAARRRRRPSAVCVSFLCVSTPFVLIVPHDCILARPVRLDLLAARRRRPRPRSPWWLRIDGRDRWRVGPADRVVLLASEV
mgnify:CR=1 FL=1